MGGHERADRRKHGQCLGLVAFERFDHQRGEHAEGLRWLEKAWRSGNVGAGFNLGTIYLRQGDTNRAEVVWQHAADRGDPTPWWVWYGSRRSAMIMRVRSAGCARS